MPYTPLIQRWFYATNHPKAETPPASNLANTTFGASTELLPTAAEETSEDERGRSKQQPDVARRSPSSSVKEERVTSLKAEQAVTYQPFSLGDQEALESAYLDAVSRKLAKGTSSASLNISTGDVPPLKTSESLPAETPVVYVREDLLFDVDLHQMVIKPAYWSGPHFDVRRSGWFLQAESNRYVPCDRILTQQLEDGWRKHKMYDASLPVPNNTEAIEKHWTLFGKYASASVEYASASEAYLYFDDFASKMAKVVTSMWSRRSGGIRLVRGWDNLPQSAKQSATSTANEATSPQKSQNDNINKDDAKAPDTDDYKDQSEARPNMNDITQLLFVVHGYSF